MSVSIDEECADGEGVHEDARTVLAGWLDDFVAERCDRADMEEAFLSVCRSNPEAPWDALALIDQYQRLGRIDAAVARDFKAPIAQLVFGLSKPGSGAAPAVARIRSVPPQAQSKQPEPRGADADEGHTDDIVVEPEPEPTRRAVRPLENAQSRLGGRALYGEAAPGPEAEFDDDGIGPAGEADPEPEVRAAAEASSTRARMRTRWSAATPSVSRESDETLWRGVPARPVASAKAGEAPRAPLHSGPAATVSKVLRERYELLSILGRGANSTVYRALDRHRANLSEAARYVAVKVLNRQYGDNAAARAELEREFHQAQSLSHPNIATVFDLDRDGGTYFIVMELLEGESLAHVLRRLDNRPMARKYALALIGSIGAALAHAHRRNIVHADLKPRNVMITSLGEMRVLNFGFAASHIPRAGDLDSGHEAVSIGTPAYASAERVHGVEPDASDDVYSLACIAYELLAGRHPYGGRSAFLARAHGRRPQRVAGLTSRQWHALHRALAWDRAERKIDIVDFLAALGTAEGPQELVPPELLVLPDDSRARRWRALGLALAIVLVVAVGTFLLTRIPAPLQRVDGTTAIPGSVAGDPRTDGAVTPRNATADGSQVADSTAAPADPPAQAESPGPSTSASAERPADAAPAAQGAANSGSIQFDKDTYVVTESEGMVRLQVVRTGSTRGLLSFRWTLIGNSAEAGADFADIGPGIERIPSGVRSATIAVPIVNDAIAENTELFLVEIEALDEGVSLGELARAVVIIVDDDG